MIEALQPNPAALRRPAPAEATGAEGFSYALAATSLEARAGASLKAFGAKEGAAAIAAPDARTPAASRATTTAAAPPTDSRAAPAEGEASPPPPSGAPTLQKSEPSLSPSPTTPAPASVAASVAASAAPATLATGAAPAPLRTEAPAREIAAARAELAPRAKPAAAATRAESHAVPQDFARLLARRLDAGASQFDLRLDPPELGRVEARLVAGADGRAELSLTFDNQSAYDLFRRDEAGLRAALLAAGFDLGAGDLAFSLNEGSEKPASPSVGARQSLAFPEPHFIAAYSRGVVDLVI